MHTGVASQKRVYDLTAGILIKHWRNHVSVERLEEVVDIYANVTKRSYLQTSSVQQGESAINNAQGINELAYSEISARN